MPWSAWTTRSPGRKRRQLLEESVGRLPLLAAADEAVAEHVLLGEDRDLGRREAMVEREDEKRRLGLGTQRLLPAIDLLLRLEAMVLEQAAKALARAAGVACEHDLAAAPAKRADMLCDRFVDVGLLRALGREIARGLRRRNR